MTYSVKPLKFTDRQIQVIRGLAAQLTYIQLAERMQITDRTVKQHVLHLKLKLGARHRRDIPALYYEQTGDNPFPK
jgi:DNA-binding CsgD family transcriptional regulator